MKLFTLIGKKETKWYFFLSVAIAVIIIQAILGILIYNYFTSWNERGTFGDMFGAVNTLFSGLAFAGLIYAILLQRSELELQRKELELARVEYERQAKALENSYSEAVKNRSAQVFEQIMDQLNDLRPKWHELYKLPSDHKEWDDSQKALADEVGTGLQQVAYLCLSGFIDSEYIMEGYAKVFVQSWDKLDTFIKDYRIASGEPSSIADGAFQRRHFEKFSDNCREYLKRFPHINMTIENHTI